MPLTKSSLPIGIFDSGVGGTSIWKEIHELMPHESTIYLADSLNAPYGIKSKEEIIRLSRKNTKLLLSKGCKIIVVACNTATTNAIKLLRQEYDIPFIGIEPAIKPASLNSKTRTIGILATKGTLSSELFYEATSFYSDKIKIIEQEGAGIVELIESGKLDSDQMRKLIRRYVNPMLKANIDHLVLGCSHYPYLIPILKEILPRGVKIIDSGLAVAKQTKAILDKNGLLNDSFKIPYRIFYTNTQTEILTAILQGNHEVQELDF